MSKINKPETIIRPHWLVVLTNTENYVAALDEITAGAGVRITTLKRFPNYTARDIELIELAIDDCLDLEELLNTKN
tara:strand:+ start:237 stop:464 length:228 start_codon:yes stop_codon:yes gene_type:complete